jgi:hypothetical protein
VCISTPPAVDLPDVLKRYEVNVDGEHDLISFPVVH